MTEAVPTARVDRAMTSDHTIRLSALSASPLWDGVRRGHPDLEPGACAALVETLAAALLLQSRNFFSERLQVLIKGSGRARAVVADSWPEGDIRGILDPAGEGAQEAWVAAPGMLSVMRSNASGHPYIGHLDLVDGPVAVQIEAYLQQSEQIQASLTLWCDPSTGEAGGLLVEPLPGCPPERMANLVHAIEGLEVVPNWERTPEFLISWINGGEGAELLASTGIRYHCRCSREALLGTLQSFPAERLQELFQGGDPVEVRCDYCGRAYQIAHEELGAGRGQG
nr:Hsp33 family molecular chaperone HslO [uncultured Holophaga sp.]